VVEHNHSLSLGKVRFFRCNKNLDSAAKRRLELNDRAGIHLFKNFNSLVVEMGGMTILPLKIKIAGILLIRQEIFGLAKEC
jgi:hypothetical protein